jgi:hypothetical protein
MSVIFWSPRYAFKLKPIYSQESGVGEECETIRYEIDKIPSGMFDTPDSEEGKQNPLDPGLGYVDGTISYEEMED